ncbi:hypothetical protein INT45_008930 [Circinella minor]|uniref:Putative gamma-glutamylcyclotransferase n=1 Tax=Circinella minor TaxID=1195481 RepID=A0A8H7S584_9FUNG|nr:hypothetical protein INT45_008930 [Circinella minor]
MSEAAFFYGTLMSSDVRSRVLGGLFATNESLSMKLGALRLRTAILKGHRRYALKGREYPGVIYTGQEEDQVKGLLCEGLFSEDVRRLDAFEGDEYKRCNVEVTPLKADGQKEDTTVNTQVYIWTEGNEYLKPYDWEFDTFVKDQQEKWLQDRDQLKDVDELDIALTEAADH